MHKMRKILLTKSRFILISHWNDLALRRHRVEREAEEEQEGGDEHKKE